MADTVIQTRDLTKQFIKRRGLSSLRHPFDKQAITAVQGINLSVQRGEIFGLLGPNGAGKTTLTKMLCTLLLPTSGSATVNSFDLVKQQAKVKGSIALISSEERSFYWRLSGRQNLRFFAALYGLPRQQAEERIPALLSQVGLTEAADRRFNQYSTGMKQRLGLARGLLANPDIFFMDEPTKGLDPVASRQTHEFVKQQLVAQGKTVVIATHQLFEAEEVCDRVGIMSGGVMVACGGVRELSGDASLSDYFLSLVEESKQEQG